jgi:hypothetical protein
MITDIKKILNELSYRVHEGSPDFENEQHLIKLYDVLKEFKWPADARIELIKTLTEAKFDSGGFGEVYGDKRGDNPHDAIKKYVDDFVKRLAKDSSTGGKVSIRSMEVVNLKKGKEPSVQVVLDLKEIGRDSRGPVVDAAQKIFINKVRLQKGGWKKHTQSVSGKLPWRPKYVNILIAFKGLKTGKAAGATTTDMKEGMVGLMFQSDVKSPVTPQNIKKILSILIKNISGIQGESSKTKSDIKKWLSGLPTEKPKKDILNQLNDPLSIALKCKSSYGSWKWDRDKLHSSARSTAKGITGLHPDKWNPADAFLVKGSPTISAGTGDSEVERIAPLNNLFVSDWGATDGNIVGVSLKQAKAQAGKGKGYLKSWDSLTTKFDYNLTKGEQELPDEEPSGWAVSVSDQISEWRKEISGKLDSSRYSYKYGSDFNIGIDDKGKLTGVKSAEFLYQKYASLKMFKFMADLLKQSKSTFVDTAAFALGITDYSPTFFKVVGSTSGKGAKVQKYQSSGGLELKGKINITDTNTAAGVVFEFKVFNKAYGTGTLKMNIRFNGSTQATLEMLSAKWGG